ncbi:MAG: nuclear transport factor 2 family protein [Blastocatellales bacterium]
MIENDFTEHFAADWIDSWNAHDLERILTHYTDDFEMTSPRIVDLGGEASGSLKGKEQVGAYWAKGLSLMPDLHFELISVLTGVSSITLYYKNHRGQFAAEVFHFNAEGKVEKAFAHYTQ